MNGFLKWSALPACAAVLAAAPALAQQRSGGPSWVPYTTSGYVGFNAGRPEYKLPCSAAFPCNDMRASFSGAVCPGFR